MSDPHDNPSSLPPELSERLARMETQLCLQGEQLARIERCLTGLNGNNNGGLIARVNGNRSWIRALTWLTGFVITIFGILATVHAATGD
ncbi:MAG: hypothetical protein ACYS8X_13655 [Planctomycetota bacterium]